jgi:hypothetical protein
MPSSRRRPTRVSPAATATGRPRCPGIATSRPCCPSNEVSHHPHRLSEGRRPTTPNVASSCSGVGEDTTAPTASIVLKVGEEAVVPTIPSSSIVLQGSRKLQLRLHYSMDCGLWWSVSL